MFNKLKSEKGITGIDLSISLIIIMLFVSIITATSVNVSTSLASKRRLEIASDCMTEIMEKIDEISYEKIKLDDNESVINIENMEKDENNSNNYDADEQAIEYEMQNILNSKEDYKILTVDIKREKFKPETEGDEDIADLVTKVTVKIEYVLNGKVEPLEVTRLKTKYNIDLTKENVVE